MAQSFKLQVGRFDLADWVRADPGEGWDPNDPDLVEPQFSQSPLREGAVHIQDVVGAREMAVPVALNPYGASYLNHVLAPNAEIGTTLQSMSGNQYVNPASVVAEIPTQLDAPEGDWVYKVFTPGANQREGMEWWTASVVQGHRYFWTLDVEPGVSTGMGIVLGAGASPFTAVSTDYDSTILPSGVWTTLSGLFTASQTGQHWLAIRNRATGAHTFRTDRAMVTRATYPVKYFDGDSLGAYWENGARDQGLSVAPYGKQGLHRMEQDLNRTLDDPTAEVRWQDTGASEVTYLDKLAGRFEPDHNYRRGAHDWQNGMVRLWTEPYGHTGTERLVATGAGSGCLLEVAVPSILQGDVAALLDVRITAGDTVPSAGRRVAFAVLPHPSYSADFPAASIGDRMGGAALTGASGADGSQYLGLPVSPTTASGIAAQVPLQIPTVYAGRNRVFALARSAIVGGVAMRMFDPFGNPLGPTAVASAMDSWALLDMGVLTVPSGPVPTTFKLPLVVGGASRGALPPQVLASPGFHLNAVYLLPEDSTVLVNDVGARPSVIAGDDLEALTGGLDGLDDFGNNWEIARSQASVALYVDAGKAIPTLLVTGNGNYIDRLVQDSLTVMELYHIPGVPSGIHSAVRRDIDSSNWIDAIYTSNPSYSISLLSVSNGATTLHASQGVGSYPAIGANGVFVPMQMALRTVGGQAAVTLRNVGGATLFLAGAVPVTIASIGASHANLDRIGNPGVRTHVPVPTNSAQTGRHVLSLYAYSVPSSRLSARDVHRFSTDDRITRNPSGLDITGYLNSDARGRIPAGPVPTTARVAALVAPVDEGVANDLTAVEVRAREQFRFSR